MKFKVGQKVVCVSPETMTHPDIVVIPRGEIVTIAGESGIYSGNYYILEYPVSKSGVVCSYKPYHFEPLIEADQFIEMTYTKILETTPKVSMS